MTKVLDERAVRIAEARQLIEADGHRTGPLRRESDLSLRVREYDGDEFVREWIATPDGRLTWRS